MSDEEIFRSIFDAWEEYVGESRHEETEITIEDFGLYLQYRSGAPVVLKNVTFATENNEDTITTDVRVNASEEGRTLEFRVICIHCRADNWIVVGTDAGEYRCINCVERL